MAIFTPTVGIITDIAAQSGCALLFTVQSEDQGLITVLLPSDAYVLGARPFEVGDRATFFYSPGAPAPLIFPPRYRALAAAYTPKGKNAYLDYFNGRLVNSDGTLILNLSGAQRPKTANGQPFYGDPAGMYLLITYGATTRSIPAQTTPDQIVVFCK